MNLAENNLSSLTNIPTDNSHDTDYYINAIKQLIAICKTVNRNTASMMMVGVAQDIIRRHHQGLELPFRSAEFLKVVKDIILGLSGEYLDNFIDILPEPLQNALRTTKRNHGDIEYNSLKDFTKYIASHFTVLQLLKIFGVHSVGNEIHDRNKITPFFTLMQGALDDYNSTTKQIDSDGAFALMCKLRGFVMTYYRSGADIHDAIGLFQKRYPSDYGLMAVSVASSNFGNLLSGMVYLSQKTGNKCPQEFFDAMFNVINTHYAYTLPNTLQDIIIPNPMLYPAIIPMGGISRPTPNNPLHNKIQISTGNIHIDISTI